MDVKRTLCLFVGAFSFSLCLNSQSLAVLKSSHDSSVKIVSRSANSSGTGFVIGDQYIMTCFHVVSALSQPQPGRVQFNLYQDLQVTFPSGETISGTVITTPTDDDPSPLAYDFAIIKLIQRPQKPAVKVELAKEDELPDLGGDIVFSGFPLATPGMVTHRGMISGTDDSKTLIFIEASINKGNSGGALLNDRGHVIGIVSMREGGISRELETLRQYINLSSRSGNSVRIMGVDPLQSTNAIIATLDQYISTGIGYARSIKFARDYLGKHPDLMK